MKNFETGETYLGDGLYASFNGFQICLRSTDLLLDNAVFLEPSVWVSLVAYVASLKRKDADSVLADSARPTP